MPRAVLATTTNISLLLLLQCCYLGVCLATEESVGQSAGWHRVRAQQDGLGVSGPRYILVTMIYLFLLIPILLGSGLNVENETKTWYDESMSSGY